MFALLAVSGLARTLAGRQTLSGPGYGGRYAVDFLWLMRERSLAVVLEVDEGAHRRVDASYEGRRMVDLSLRYLTDRCLFIRYDPSGGLTQFACWEHPSRERTEEGAVRGWLGRSLGEFAASLVSVEPCRRRFLHGDDPSVWTTPACRLEMSLLSLLSDALQGAETWCAPGLTVRFVGYPADRALLVRASCLAADKATEGATAPDTATIPGVASGLRGEADGGQAGADAHDVAGAGVRPCLSGRCAVRGVELEDEVRRVDAGEVERA